MYEGYEVYNKATSLKAAALWEKLGCPYEQALCFFEGSDIDKRKAITIIHELCAETIYEKMKLEMRTSGIKSIPRGIRKTTQANFGKHQFSFIWQSFANIASYSLLIAVRSSLFLVVY